MLRKDILVDKPEAPTEVYQWITLEKVKQEQEQQAAQAAEAEEYAEKREDNNASSEIQEVLQTPGKPLSSIGPKTDEQP